MQVTWEFVNSCIPDRLQSLLPQLGECMGLLRGWDSGRDPKRIVEVLAGFELDAVSHPAGALLGLENLAAPEFAENLYGFDELWIGRPGTDWDRLVDLPAMTSEGIQFERNDPGPFTRALQESGALCAMGDGVGLNFCRVEGTLDLDHPA